VQSWALLPVERQLFKYPLAATQYLRGELPAERIVDFSPLYFHLNVLFASALGGGAADGPWITALIGLQVLAAAATTGVLCLLLLRLFPQRLALLGVAAFILARGMTVYSSVLEPEVILVFFLVAFLYLSLHVGLRYEVLAGMALALAVATRPSVLPVLLAVPVHFACSGRRTSWHRATSRVFAPVLLALLLIGMRNGTVTGSYSPIVMNPGFVFFEGNNPLSPGRSAVYPPLVSDLTLERGNQPDSPHIFYRLVAERSTDTRLTTSGANRFWRGRALAFARDQPRRFLSVVASKFWFTFHAYRRHDVATAEYFDRRLRELFLPTISLAFISAAAAWGVFSTVPAWRTYVLFHGLLGSQTVVTSLFYVSERQRLPLLPVLIVFACAGLSGIAAVHGRRRAVAVVLCSALAIALLTPSRSIHEEQHLWSAYQARDRLWSLAYPLRDQGRSADAVRAAAVGYAATPWLRDYSRPARLSFEPGGFAEQALSLRVADGEDPSLRFDRAQLLIDAGRHEQARKQLEDLVEKGVRFDRGAFGPSDPALYLARLVAQDGDPTGAAELLRRALERAPGDPFLLADIAALTGDRNARGLLARYFSELDASMLLGMAQLEYGTVDHGVSELSRVAERVPEFWRLRIYLAAALGAASRLEEARSVYWEAMARQDDPVLLEDRIIGLFDQLRLRSPSSARANLEHGIVLAQYGHFDSAMVSLRTARALEPGPEVDRAISEVEQMRLAHRPPR
jgi:Flp pilus assembly protein TadD